MCGVDSRADFCATLPYQATPSQVAEELLLQLQGREVQIASVFKHVCRLFVGEVSEVCQLQELTADCVLWQSVTAIGFVCN